MESSETPVVIYRTHGALRLISSSLFLRRITSNERIFLKLILTMVGFDEFKPVSNNVGKKFSLSPLMYDGVGGGCKCGDPFIVNFGVG